MNFKPSIPEYEPMDHTGDLAWKVKAPSFAELVAKASRALTDTLVEANSIEALSESHWEVSGETREGLLVGQLQEILYLFDAKGMVFREFDIEATDTHILCRARGEKVNPKKHGFKTEIKAVTYHQLSIAQDAEGNWEAKVVLDV